MLETPDSACHSADALLKSGDALRAYDLLAEALAVWPAHLRLRQLAALALARLGASFQANLLLHQLVAEGHGDEETVGLLARTHKDLWANAKNNDEGREHLARAARYYEDAYRTTGGYWSGINAATMALLEGRRDHAHALAGRVEVKCRTLLAGDQAPPDRYWTLATLGEAALILGNIEGASHWYQQAIQSGHRGLGDIVSTRRNARLLLDAQRADQWLVNEWLPVPPVVVFCGHLVDQPGRGTPRFPESLEAAVRAAIETRLRVLGPVIGYASAACGADILFLECVAAANAPTHIVLPYGGPEFREDSVDVVPGSNWGLRYERALERAADVTVASEHRLGSGGVSHQYGFRMLDGTASLRADDLDTDLICMTVWDGRPGDGPGGTADAVAHWRRQGRRVEVIDLAALHRETGIAGQVVEMHDRSPATPVAARDSASTGARHRTSFDPRVVGLLFADAQGFSRLSEHEIPLFVEHFLGLVAREMARLPEPPLLANTWGDGIYLVFNTMADTGTFAVRLRDAVKSTDWQALGFAEGLGVRIGLHAGPAYACQDPVTGRQNFIGAHVSRAARIEPITPPGEVYASDAFAALMRTDRVKGFACTYVGQTPLAKGYGTYRTYIVRPTSRT